MNTYYYALDHNGDYLFDNFPNEVKDLIISYKENKDTFLIELNGGKCLARIGCKINEYGKIFTLTTEKKYIERYKFFKELVDKSSFGLKSLSQLNRQNIEDNTKQTEEFIHNLTSLHTYSLQNLFRLIPQNTLTGNINTQKEIINGIINSNIELTVDSILKLIKYNLAMKVEFSVFDRTLKPNAYLKKISHSMRDIVLSALQIFIDDFDQKNITVSLESCDKRLDIDYDSLFVSLFYLLDNSIKYCCPNTLYKIKFHEDDNNIFSISFIMISIKIESNEINKLTSKGYRSPLANRLNDKGSGLGMFRILKTLNLNDATLEIVPRYKDYTKKINGIEYEANLFKFKFKNQEDWFKC